MQMVKKYSIELKYLAILFYLNSSNHRKEIFHHVRSHFCCCCQVGNAGGRMLCCVIQYKNLIKNTFSIKYGYVNILIINT